MSVVRSVSPGHSSPQRGVPPLVAGDRLTRAEFERRYLAMPEINKAELIEGIVYMPSPVRLTGHAQQHLFLAGWLSYYLSKTPLLAHAGDNATVRLDEDNEPQPDLCLLLPAAAGGAAKVDADDYIAGAPELVCEVSGSTVSMDLNQKLDAYRRNGVREYVVWRVDDSAIDFFALHQGKYKPLPADPGGIVRSQVFPGLWLDVPAMLSGDLQKVFAAIDRGAASAEHASFVRRLQEPPSGPRR
jgi:Uma2 family endonuclease